MCLDTSLKSPYAFDMGKYFLLLLVLIAAPVREVNAGFFSAHSHARCGDEVSQGREWSYCIYRYPDSTDQVLYYFHGILGSEFSWETEGSEKTIIEHLRKNGKRPPTVVSISFGNEWFLAEQNSSDDSGLFEITTTHVLPRIENSLLGFKSRENLLFGLSMGGLNGAQLYFKKPGFFSRAALICGAMATVSPHGSDEEIDNYINRTGASRWRVQLMLSLARRYFPTEADWQKHSPLALAEQFLNPLSVPIYMSNGLSDPYGFHEGNLNFVEIAKNKGAPLISEFFPGTGHCKVDRTAIADFLIP